MNLFFSRDEFICFAGWKNPSRGKKSLTYFNRNVQISHGMPTAYR